MCVMIRLCVFPTVYICVRMYVRILYDPSSRFMYLEFE